MEKLYRKHQGDDQLDFWPRTSEPDWFWRRLPIIVILIVIVMLYAPIIFR